MHALACCQHHPLLPHPNRPPTATSSGEDSGELAALAALQKRRKSLAPATAAKQRYGDFFEGGDRELERTLNVGGTLSVGLMCDSKWMERHINGRDPIGRVKELGSSSSSRRPFSSPSDSCRTRHFSSPSCAGVQPRAGGQPPYDASAAAEEPRGGPQPSTGAWAGRLAAG